MQGAGRDTSSRAAGLLLQLHRSPRLYQARKNHWVLHPCPPPGRPAHLPSTRPRPPPTPHLGTAGPFPLPALAPTSPSSLLPPVRSPHPLGPGRPSSTLLGSSPTCPSGPRVPNHTDRLWIRICVAPAPLDTSGSRASPPQRSARRSEVKEPRRPCLAAPPPPPHRVPCPAHLCRGLPGGPPDPQGTGLPSAAACWGCSAPGPGQPRQSTDLIPTQAPAHTSPAPLLPGPGSLAGGGFRGPRAGKGPAHSRAEEPAWRTEAALSRAIHPGHAPIPWLGGKLQDAELVAVWAPSQKPPALPPAVVGAPGGWSLWPGDRRWGL